MKTPTKSNYNMVNGVPELSQSIFPLAPDEGLMEILAHPPEGYRVSEVNSTPTEAIATYVKVTSAVV